MNRVFAILTRRTVNSHATVRHDVQLAVNVLERRAILGRQVVPYSLVATVDGVPNLVDLGVANVARDLDCDLISIEEETGQKAGLRKVPQPS